MIVISQLIKVLTKGQLYNRHGLGVDSHKREVRPGPCRCPRPPPPPPTARGTSSVDQPSNKIINYTCSPPIRKHQPHDSAEAETWGTEGAAGRGPQLSLR